MAGKGNKRVRLSGETSKVNRRDLGTLSRSSEPVDEQQSRYNLPPDLLQVILSQLSLRDNIRASAVCKIWRDVALSIQVDRVPWLVNLAKTGELYEFYNPFHRKTYNLEFPELRDARVVYAKDNWWLLFKPITQQLLFFCPYTLESINMPDFDVSDQVVAFSAAPTSPSCVLFMIKHHMALSIAISTCCPGDAAWTTMIYECNIPCFYSILNNKVVFCNGVFHCISVMGMVGIYDHEKQTWSICYLNRPSSAKLFSIQDWWKGMFVAEHNGDIHVLYTCLGFPPTIYKLNLATPAWEEVQDFGGKTFFANFFSSYIKADLVGNMRNNIYFSKVLYYGKQCVRYSLEEKRYYPRKDGFDCRELDPFDSIWFEPPKDLSSIQ